MKVSPITVYARARASALPLALTAIALSVAGASAAAETTKPSVKVINDTVAETRAEDAQVVVTRWASDKPVAADTAAADDAHDVAKTDVTKEDVAIEREPIAPPSPTLDISIDLSSQTMTVSERGVDKYTWKISSGRWGYKTPTGSYKPQWMARRWHSRKYDMAPMPYSIFFHKGYAIHATYATRRLGRPASHGCIRLSKANARKLFKMVSRHGKSKTHIEIYGEADFSRATYAKRKRSQRKVYSTARVQAPHKTRYVAPRYKRQPVRHRAHRPRGLFSGY